ncbi:hypothetical protein D8Y22_12780 [Salinadaptatus halalkaliphilus]|uniref:Uncharacterized protein n=1 Tax=Salinadaptatus halalkaliphilus TaxID=2419781 RepID=A0A4S3TK77_9EURY|nr:hypothetical protein [Salinadaptatus halalkaliphilus]THE64512.1 hypothetical protein D8Y22_12780 [Salinadaptatus halalkaliphilus]
MSTNTDQSRAASSAKANGQSPTQGVARRSRSKPESLGSKDSEYVDTIVEADAIHERWQSWLETDFSKDFPLAKYPGGHAEDEELLVLNRMDMFRKSHPPEESAMQGEIREGFVGDQKESVGADDLYLLQSYLRRIVARMTRGERGWQQDKFDGVLSVSKTESQGGRSLKEKIFG